MYIYKKTENKTTCERVLHFHNHQAYTNEHGVPSED